VAAIGTLFSILDSPAVGTSSLNQPGILWTDLTPDLGFQACPAHKLISRHCFSSRRDNMLLSMQMNCSSFAAVM
jgi:hypothetical protein